MSMQAIKLDCPPGDRCPGDLIAGVIEGTGLRARKPILVAPSGWTWDYRDVPAKRWKQVQPILKERIEALRRKGLIRSSAGEEVASEA